MKFPGENEITLTEEAIRQLLKAQAPALFGDEDARITKIATKSWPSGLVVTFTTDPDPAAVIPVPRSSRTHALPESAPEPMPSASPRADDDHPF